MFHGQGHGRNRYGARYQRAINLAIYEGFIVRVGGESPRNKFLSTKHYLVVCDTSVGYGLNSTCPVVDLCV